MSFIDYYELLQVSPKAHQEVIRSAYRTMMSKLNNHPDKGGDEEKAKLLNEAYEILCNEEKRKMYDQRYTNFSRNSNFSSYTNKFSSSTNKISVSESQTIYGHTKAIDIVSIGNYNSILASCHNSGLLDTIAGAFFANNYDTQVKLRNIRLGQELQPIHIAASYIKSLRISCYSNSIAVGTDSHIYIGDIDTQSIIYLLKSNGDNFGGVAFKDDLSILFVGVKKGIEVINTFTNELMKILPHSHLQEYIYISNNGKYLASSPLQNKFFHIWDVNNSINIRSIRNPSSTFSVVAVNETGEILAVSNKKDSITFFNILSGEKIQTMYYPSGQILFSPNNKYFIMGDNFGVVRLFDINSFDELITFKAHTEGITSLCFASDDSKIITGSKDKSIKIWDIQ